MKVELIPGSLKHSITLLLIEKSFHYVGEKEKTEQSIMRESMKFQEFSKYRTVFKRLVHWDIVQLVVLIFHL